MGQFECFKKCGSFRFIFRINRHSYGTVGLPYNPDLVSKDKIIDYLLKTFDIIDKNSIIMSTYCDGIAGYGFFLMKLNQSNTLEQDNDDDNEIRTQIDEILTQTDEVLEEQIGIFISHDNCDMLHGLVGLGIYFLERNNFEQVNRIITYLKETSFRKGNQVYWKKYDKYRNYTTVIDMGTAHGNASIMFFLSKAISKQATDQNVTELIKGNIHFYLQNEQIFDEDINTFFPTFIKAEDFDQNILKKENSRLAWCYGDLGALYTMLITAVQVDDAELYTIIVSKLRHVAKRKFETEGFTIDAGFCHGTSGISMIFENIYDITGEKEFSEAAHYWIEETLKHKYSSEIRIEKIGYSFLIKDTENEQNFSLLEGLTGVLCSYKHFLFKNSLTQESLLLKF